MYYFVNKRIAFVSYIIIHKFKNLCSLTLRLAKKRTINVHNIYNLCKNNKNESNLLFLRATIAKKVDNEHIVIRDFNLYYLK